MLKPRTLSGSRGTLAALALLTALVAAHASCADDTQVDPVAFLDGGGVATGDGSTTSSDAAPPPPPAKIEDLLEPLRAGSGVPGIAALVVRSGVVIAEGAAGVRKLGDDAAVTTSDRWHLGTDAQTMTATLAATVVERGELSWSSTIGAVLPDIAIHASYDDVTLEQLLGHRGGAPAALPASVDQAMRMPGAAQTRRDEAVHALLAAGPEIAPGTAVRRSDAGYLIAASMLERATKTPWEDLVRARVFVPLGMLGCGFDPIGAAAGVVEPWGHVTSNDMLTPVFPGAPPEPPAAFGPAGRVRCPLRDVAKLAALHLAGARGEPTAILGAPSFAMLQTPVLATQALGWNAVSRPWAGDALALVAESANPLFVALMWVAPARDVAFVVVANESDSIALSAVDAVVAKLIERFAPPEGAE